MKLDDPCMANLPRATRNYILGHYVASLVQGETILSGSIRSRTMRHYVNDALALFRLRKVRYSGLDITDYIWPIITALKKYEDVPNRRHMISDSMRHHLQRQAAISAPDSEAAAVHDWVCVGSHNGARRKEFCQRSQTKYDVVEDAPGQPAAAFIRSDFTFLNAHERRLDDDELTEDSVAAIRFKWRFQKNRDNGEEKDFARDDVNPNFCCCRASLRIYKRAVRHNVPAGIPIGIFVKKGKWRFLTADIVAKHLRLAARATMNVTCETELRRWSTHSVRVTAANLLHRANMSDSFIKSRLRWKSDTFLMYLRNTIYAARQHTAALTISESNLPPVDERVYREPEAHEIVVAAAAAAVVA